MSKTSLEHIVNRYTEFFESPGDRMEFEKVVEVVDNAVNTAVSNDVGVIGKFIVFSDAEKSIESFADFRRYIPATVVNNLAEDLRWVLAKARETATILWMEENKK
ncbi:MAG: hypothetical protein QXS50_05040 [Candidatus Caldarchaeum sp.]